MSDLEQRHEIIVLTSEQAYAQGPFSGMSREEIKQLRKTIISFGNLGIQFAGEAPLEGPGIRYETMSTSRG